MRLIDADKLLVSDEDCSGKCRDCNNNVTNCTELADLVNAAQTIDVVPREKYERMKESAEILSKACAEKEYVVRCKDCKYYSPFKNGQGQCDRQICCVTFLDDYCSYGERGEADDSTGSD